MKPKDVHALIMAFPQVEEGVSYGHPAYKAFGKFFTRLRASDQSLVLMQVSFDEREMLMEVDPATFHFTEHYKGYPIVLARISGLEPEQLKGFLTRQWRHNAPKRFLKAFDAAKA